MAPDHLPRKSRGDSVGNVQLSRTWIVILWIAAGALAAFCFWRFTHVGNSGIPLLIWWSISLFGINLMNYRDRITEIDATCDDGSS